MKSSEGKIGRVFILRLEDGDMVPEVIERFAAEKGIKVAHVILTGGIAGGKIVVGPRKTEEMPPDPVLMPIDEVHEVAGLGIIAPDKNGKPILHMHASFGRGDKALTGCLRLGVKTWLVGEAVIFEIKGTSARRLMNKASGFELMEM